MTAPNTTPRDARNAVPQDARSTTPRSARSMMPQDPARSPVNPVPGNPVPGNRVPGNPPPGSLVPGNPPHGNPPPGNPVSGNLVPVARAHIPGIPPRPGDPGWPSPPPGPGVPPSPGVPPAPGVPGFPSAPPPVPGPLPPTRVWLDPGADWAGALYERLLARRIVLASGLLDDEAAARLSAQLLTLDAERDQPIRLELQNLRAELSATVTLMGILDVLRVPVRACVSGEINGPALGVLASCPRRSGYPNATFVLAEPRMQFGGTVAAVTAREQQVTRMLDTLYFRLAEVTGREVDEIREDARRGRTLTTGQAIGYGLIQSQETAGRPPLPGGLPDPGRDDPRRH